MANGRPWTTLEDRYIRDNYGTAKVSEIAIHLGRSENAVRLYANRIGLKSSLPHKSPTRLVLQAMIQEGHHPTVIAYTLGKSTKGVYNSVRDQLGGNWYYTLKLNARTVGKMTTIKKAGIHGAS